MFNVNAEYLNEEINSGGKAINKNGCYEVKIDKFKIWKSDESQTESANITFVTDDGKKAWVSLFYKKKTGEVIDFNQKILTHLSFVVGVNGAKQDEDGHVKDYIGKELGIVVKVDTEVNQKGEDSYKFSIVDVYNPNTLQTAYERFNKIPTKAVAKYRELYKDAEEVKLNSIKEVKEDDGFDGFFEINNDDIPF